MSTKSFTEDSCDVYAAWGNEGRPLGERGTPVSDFTYRAGTLARRQAGVPYPVARMRAEARKHGLSWTPACGTDAYAHSCAASDLRLAGFDRLQEESSFTRSSNRDLSNQRFYELLGNTHPYTPMDRYDLTQILANQIAAKNLCAKNPIVYAGRDMPLFLHSNVNTQNLYRPAYGGYQYEQGSSKELLGYAGQNLAANQQVQPLSIPSEVGQNTRISDPTKKFCRSDFAPNLPAL